MLAGAAQYIMKYLTKTITLPNGKRKYVRAKTKAELEEKFAVVKREIDAGVDVSDNTLFEDYANQWFRLSKEPHISETTARIYRDFTMHKVYPYIGAIKLRNIRASHIRDVMFRCSDLSHRAQSMVLGFMRNVFDSAVDDGIIVRSPVPLTLRAGGSTSPEAECLTPEQESALLEAAWDTDLYPLVYTLLNTGLRRGEATALMWRDIDWGAGEIHVHQHVIMDENGRPVIVEGTKTEAGERFIPMTDQLSSLLRREQSKARSVFVFPNGKGELYSASALSSAWKTLDKRAGFHTHPHMLRHTYATKLFEAGTLDIREIQDILGHANPGITLNTYTHYRDGSRRQSTFDKVKVALG